MSDNAKISDNAKTSDKSVVYLQDVNANIYELIISKQQKVLLDYLWDENIIDAKQVKYSFEPFIDVMVDLTGKGEVY